MEKILIWVLGVSVAAYSPYLIWAIYNRVEILGFVSVFLGIAEKPEWSGTVLKVFQRYDSGIVEFAHLFYTANGFFLTILLLLPVYYLIRIRFEDKPQNYVFFLTVYLVVIMMAWHITNDRHTIILLPPMVFLIGYTLNQLATNKLILRSIFISLVLIAGYLTYQMPNYRQRYNAPEDFLELTKIINENTASDARILCLSKFDIIVYTQRPIIWPHARLDKLPIELLKKQNADKLFALLKHYKIKYIVIETPRIVDVEKFHSGRYPLYFVRTCEQLERLGKLRFVDITKSKRFVLLGVI